MQLKRTDNRTKIAKFNLKIKKSKKLTTKDRLVYILFVFIIPIMFILVASYLGMPTV